MIIIYLHTRNCNIVKRELRIKAYFHEGNYLIHCKKYHAYCIGSSVRLCILHSIWPMDTNHPKCCNISKYSGIAIIILQQKLHTLEKRVLLHHYWDAYCYYDLCINQKSKIKCIFSVIVVHLSNIISPPFKLN